MFYQPVQTWTLALFADDQVTIVYSEDNLQRGVFTLLIIAKNFGMEISPEKSEMMAFLRHDEIRCKIVVNNKCTTNTQF